jgi:hypothetical protein
MLPNTGLQHADRASEMALPYRIGIASVKEFFSRYCPDEPGSGGYRQTHLALSADRRVRVCALSHAWPAAPRLDR